MLLKFILPITTTFKFCFLLIVSCKTYCVYFAENIFQSNELKVKLVLAEEGCSPPYLTMRVSDGAAPWVDQVQERKKNGPREIVTSYSLYVQGIDVSLRLFGTSVICILPWLVWRSSNFSFILLPLPAFFLLPAWASQSAKQLLCQWGRREWQKRTKSLKETSMVQGRGSFFGSPLSLDYFTRG